MPISFKTNEETKKHTNVGRFPIIGFLARHEHFVWTWPNQDTSVFLWIIRTVKSTNENNFDAYEFYILVIVTFDLHV